MATHSSILAWRIPGTEEPGGLPFMGLHRAMAVIRALEKKGLLTAMEVERIRERLIRRFNPIWGHLPQISALSIPT